MAIANQLEREPGDSSAPSKSWLANRLESLRMLVLLIGSILLGCAAGLFFLTRVFVQIPTDVQRLGVLLEALHEEKPQPEVVVFGNSVLMSGIDARALSQALPGQPTAWNCASTGQTLVEAFLMTQELPPSVRAAVYSIPIQPGTEESQLHPQKYNTLFMNGFRPTSKTTETLDRIYGGEISEILRRSTVSQIFASRWALRQFIDTQTRVLLRADLSLEKATRDLFHPQSYEKPIEGKITDRFIEEGNRAYAEDPPTVEEGSVALASELAEGFTPGQPASGAQAAPRRQILFLIPPIHPRLLEQSEESLRNAVDILQSELARIPDARVIDATRLLSADFYIDDKHPTNAGAKRLTEFVAEALSQN